MDKYVIYKEFNKLKVTTKQNYDTVWQDASKIIDFNSFRDEEAVKQYLINEWKLLEEQIIIVR